MYTLASGGLGVAEGLILALYEVVDEGLTLGLILLEVDEEGDTEEEIDELGLTLLLVVAVYSM